MASAKIGVIGGSGVYHLEGVDYHDEITLSTPYGDPSDAIRLGRYAGKEIAFLPRHGRTHKWSPTFVPYQANIYAMKQLGVEWIIAVNACGSLNIDMKPLDFVVPDQVIDRTRLRCTSLFEPVAVHIPFADPFSDPLRKLLIESIQECGVSVHEKGTYLCMEGPAFSTRAESNLYRSWGADIIGMTALPEAKLAREAEISYAIVAAVTDYDCWHEEDVDVEMVLKCLAQNAENLKKLVKTVIPKIPEQRDPACPAVNALSTSVVTQSGDYPEDKREAFEFLLAKYRNKA
ncbi:MAG: S-methyl-5'-thioadenosine phosphorylase [bacterium]|nr:S-methyl-5'-thioadenosine phosphorylase [bacterium]